jgi:hypothetical protein
VLGRSGSEMLAVGRDELPFQDLVGRHSISTIQGRVAATLGIATGDADCWAIS